MKKLVVLVLAVMLLAAAPSAALARRRVTTPTSSNPTAQLTIQVRNVCNGLVPGVSVELQPMEGSGYTQYEANPYTAPAGTTFSGTVDSAGNVVFNGVPYGDYILIASGRTIYKGAYEVNVLAPSVTKTIYVHLLP